MSLLHGDMEAKDYETKTAQDAIQSVDFTTENLLSLRGDVDHIVLPIMFPGVRA